MVVMMVMMQKLPEVDVGLIKALGMCEQLTKTFPCHDALNLPSRAASSDNGKRAGALAVDEPALVDSRLGMEALGTPGTWSCGVL